MYEYTSVRERESQCMHDNELVNVCERNECDVCLCVSESQGRTRDDSLIKLRTSHFCQLQRATHPSLAGMCQTGGAGPGARYR